VKMIAAHVGRPCPTRREVMEWTGVQRRHVWAFLRSLEERGTIEMEVRDPDPTRPEMPRRRRLRVTGGMWTDWTARFQARKAPRPQLLQMMNGWEADAGA
jgi:DNA-binding transcriptional MocR family regulator